MVEKVAPLKGKRTYISTILLVITALQAIVPAINVLSPEVSAWIVSGLGIATAYFRKQA